MAEYDRYLVVAVIASAFGVKGWLNIKSFTDPLSNVLGYRDCFVAVDGKWQPVTVEDGKPHGKGLVIKLQGCDDRSSADKYKGCQLAIDRMLLPEAAEGEYYWYQLENMQVRLADDEASLLGKVSHLIETGSNDVLVVVPCEGSIDQRERLLPYRPECVLEVDLETNVISVDWDINF